MDLNDYLASGSFGTGRTKQTSANWSDHYTTYRATRDAFAKAVGEDLEVHTRFVLLYESACRANLQKKVNKYAAAFNAADEASAIMFNSLLDEDTGKQIGTQDYSPPMCGWNFNQDESGPDGMEYDGFTKVEAIEECPSSITYPEGGFKMGYLTDMQNKTAIAWCEFKQLMGMLRGLNLPEGNATGAAPINAYCTPPAEE